MVSIPACHAGGRGFKSRPIRQKDPAVQYRLYGWNCAKVAQSVEHTTENRSVGSSILPFGTKKNPVMSGVLLILEILVFVTLLHNFGNHAFGVNVHLAKGFVSCLGNFKTTFAA